MGTNRKKKGGLGKGLSALLENTETDITSKNVGPAASSPSGGTVGSVSAIPIGQIEANPFQPRTHFESEALAELTASIGEHGIIQPVTVRKMGYDKYQLISGERRFRASQMARLENIPAYVRIANDQSMLEMALVENIQRENLNAIEVALSYQRLIDECQLTQEDLSEKVGKKRSTITNYLRLLKLPVNIQLGIRNQHISMGHARALVNVGDEKIQSAIYNKIIRDALSVRQTEALVKDNAKGKKEEKPTENTKKMHLNFHQRRFRDDLSQHLNSTVNVNLNDKGEGKIVIPFKTEGELERIINLLDF